MPKRALSPSRANSSSSSWSRQPCARLQLLHGLPACLLSTVCSFLSIYQVVSVLRSTCRVLHGTITGNCLLQAELVISSRSLPSLIASKSSARALLSRIASLTVF
jgi:hypothetical protein